MRFAKFWTRQQGEAVAPNGERIRVRARGWSDESIEDARAKGQQTARLMAQSIAAGRRDEYQYDRPLAEPLIQQMPGGLVTRNSYGSLVLNATDLMFVDVDDARAIQRAEQVAMRHSLAARVYQTAAGFRLAITDRRMQPATPQAESLLHEFGSDPLYIRLCKTQESFRARLTPKPWRCDLRKPPVTFPFETAEERRALENWLTEYNRTIVRWATCKYLRTIGGVRFAEGLDDLVAFHDEQTKAATSLPLA